MRGATRPIRSCDPTTQSYPHTRGAHHVSDASTRQETELSPRTWGKWIPPSSPTLGQRVIPTNVGQISQDDGDVQFSPSYPHTRGANSQTRVRVYGDEELSPHTWGKYFSTGANGGQLSSFHSTSTRIILAAG